MCFTIVRKHYPYIKDPMKKEEKKAIANILAVTTLTALKALEIKAA